MLIRRLVLALLLCCSGLVVASGPAAAACPPGNPTLQQQARQAGDVFTGSVSEQRAGERRVTYTVAVDRVYKGGLDSAQATVSTSASPRRCGLPDLRHGRTYVFFADSDGTALVITRSGGTAPATDDLVNRVEGMLGGGHPPTPPAPIEATFTPVGDDRPTFARVAAPGAALVIVGLLGLLLVGFLGRRGA